MAKGNVNEMDSGKMVTIQAGAFLMGTLEKHVDELYRLMKEEWARTVRGFVERGTPQHTITLAEYAISRYPIINAEFAHFVEGGGYDEREYWTEAGWQHKERESWTQPGFWEDAQWNAPSQPVVGVSWYEAFAYCRWLSAKTGRDYRLPTEAEWEKAARGTEGRRYPWGNEWDASRCNNSETGLNRTTPVGQYPDGDSPDGVSEMVGQVWEWCSSKYGGTDESKPQFGYPYRPDDGREELEGVSTRILRGGAWNDGVGWSRCDNRRGVVPWNRDFDRGFRYVWSF